VLKAPALSPLLKSEHAALEDYMQRLPKDSEGYCYYIKLKTNKGTFYKIGFTTKESIEERFSYGGSDNYKLISKVLMYKYSLYAYDIEQLLHNCLQKHKVYNKDSFLNIFKDLSLHPFFNDGQTELYKYDVLGLDSDDTTLFGFIRRNKTDLVNKRKLFFNKVYDTSSGTLKLQKDKKAEIKTYEILDDFLKSPLVESKKQFEERNGYWFISLRRWSIRNAADSFLYNTTIHGAKPFPKTKEEFMELRVFETVWCYVDSLPTEIEYLTNLEVIKCPYSNIKELPNAVYSLKKLKELSLSGCDIGYISSKIENLYSLEILDISQCHRITHLPNELFMLKNLKSLDLSFLKIDSIPSCIKNLTSLEMLRIVSCENLKYLPIELEKMPNLKKIQVRYDDLEAFRKCLPNKSHLIVC
jgi:hypothetical protein